MKRLPHRIEYPLSVVLRKLRVYVDRRAMLKGTTIQYSYFDFNTRKVERKVLELPAVLKIFHELNPRVGV